MYKNSGQGDFMLTETGFKKGSEYFEIYQKIFRLHAANAGANTVDDWRTMYEAKNYT